ncbi:MAG: YXWGXW repeat-containing protein [Thermodesulfobacteriota bacterium]
MITKRAIRWRCLLVLLLAAGIGFGLPQQTAAEENPPGENEVQVLAHGPIHEAFAETVAYDPQPGARAPKEAPPPIEESPPEQKPEGDVKWIPGYWSWDEDRNDFIWVSGVWRVPPPGRQWIPGYWRKSNQGFQWISGYWVSIQITETEYLPEPPESVELGPNVNAPSPEYAWIPGCWLWKHGRYVWRPGYWAKMQPDWIWVPARYFWTPRGYVFIGGYWDYPVVRRGVIFAPVFFPPVVLTHVAFSFSPGFVIDLNVFSDCLFIRPGYRHYYFGDYYAPKYYQRGIYPWFSLHARRRGYDPIFAHQRWIHRHDHEWEHRLQNTFQERRQHKEARPSRWVTSSVRYGKDSAPATGRGRQIAIPVDQAMSRKDSSFRYQRLNENERKEIRQRENEVRTYGKERRQWENPKMRKPAETSSEFSGQNRTAIPRSPIASRPLDQLDRKAAPPNRYKVPKTNPAVEPLQRRTGTSSSASTWGREARSETRGERVSGGTTTPRESRPGRSGDIRR